MPLMAGASKYQLAAFTTAIVSGLELGDENDDGRLSPERSADVTSRLQALELARQRAEAASRHYHVR